MQQSNNVVACAEFPQQAFYGVCIESIANLMVFLVLRTGMRIASCCTTACRTCRPCSAWPTRVRLPTSSALALLLQRWAGFALHLLGLVLGTCMSTDCRSHVFLSPLGEGAHTTCAKKVFTDSMEAILTAACTQASADLLGCRICCMEHPILQASCNHC